VHLVGFIIRRVLLVAAFWKCMLFQNSRKGFVNLFYGDNLVY